MGIFDGSAGSSGSGSLGLENGRVHTAPRPRPTFVPDDKDKAAQALQTLLECAGGSGELRAQVAELQAQVEELQARGPREVCFKVGEKFGKVVKGARPELMSLVGRVAAGFVNLWLSGPAGSGKTTIAKSLAQALGRPFGFQSFSAASTEGSLIGGVDAQGNYRETAFIQAYESGGVYLLDEIDAAPAEILVAVNAALANGHLALPRHTNPERRVIKRHPETIIITAANTWGTGATALYCGRAPIDGATLDRFVGARFLIGYDSTLEESILQGVPHAAEFLSTLREARERIGTSKLQRILSTRAVDAARKLIGAGFNLGEVWDEITIGWTSEEKAKVNL